MVLFHKIDGSFYSSIESNGLVEIKEYIQGVSKKKGNRTLQCSSAFIIQSTEITLAQAERPGF